MATNGAGPWPRPAAAPVSARVHAARGGAAAPGAAPEFADLLAASVCFDGLAPGDGAMGVARPEARSRAVRDGVPDRAGARWRDEDDDRALRGCAWLPHSRTADRLAEPPTLPHGTGGAAACGPSRDEPPSSPDAPAASEAVRDRAPARASGRDSGAGAGAADDPADAVASSPPEDPAGVDAAATTPGGQRGPVPASGPPPAQALGPVPASAGGMEAGEAPAAGSGDAAAQAALAQALMGTAGTGTGPQGERRDGRGAWTGDTGATPPAEIGPARTAGVQWAQALAGADATSAASAMSPGPGGVRHAVHAEAMAEATQALLAHVVKAARLAWTSRGGEARLTVDAGPDLGPVQVVLQVSRGQVSATLQAEAVAVQRVLDSARGDLQRGLAEHGLDLHRFAVSVSPDGRRRQAAADEPPARRPRARRPDVRFEEFV